MFQRNARSARHVHAQRCRCGALAAALADPGKSRRSGIRQAAAFRVSRRLSVVRWNADADEALDAAVARLRQHGAEVVAVGFPPPWREANLVHRTIMLFEAAQNLGALQERERARLSPEVNAALDEGRAISAVDYKVAMVLRDAAIVSFTEWLDGYDAVVCRRHRARARGAGFDGRSLVLHAVVVDRLPRARAADRTGPNGMPLGMQIARPPAPTTSCSRSRVVRGALPFKGLV
jgi:hypothetical protein